VRDLERSGSGGMRESSSMLDAGQNANAERSRPEHFDKVSGGIYDRPWGTLVINKSGTEKYQCFLMDSITIFSRREGSREGIGVTCRRGILAT
jgi:hypothetical protein